VAAYYRSDFFDKHEAREISDEQEEPLVEMKEGETQADERRK
jgi:hypothetical protein